MPTPLEVGKGAVDLVARRLRGELVVDEWGVDDDVADIVVPLATMVLRITVDGPGRLPASGAAVLLVNQRLAPVELMVVLRAVQRETGRHARFLGIPDVAPVGPALRRIGGAVDRPEEMAGLLRHGNLVVGRCQPVYRHRFRAGSLDPAVLGPALDLGVPVIPMALVGDLIGHWHVVVGDEVHRPPGRSPLSLAQLAQDAQQAVQDLLDEANPPRWLLG